MKKKYLVFLSVFLFVGCSFLPTKNTEKFDIEKEKKIDQELDHFYEHLKKEKQTAILDSIETEKKHVEEFQTEIKKDIIVKKQMTEKTTEEAKEETVKKIIQKEKILKRTVWKNKEEVVKKIEKETKILKDMISMKKILFIGDSVMKGSERQLQKMFPNATIDAAVSRQFTVLPDILRKSQQNGLPNFIVIHLGSNGTFDEKQMTEAMKIIGHDRKVFFINCKVEKPWEEPVNLFLKTEVAKYKNAKLVDWYAISHQATFFAKDGVHPNQNGAKRYRQMIQSELEKEL